MATTPMHCPGFQTFKNLSAFTCNCPNCGHEIEIFSDEFNKPHVCKNCHQDVDFTKCTLAAEGETKDMR